MYSWTMTQKTAISADLVWTMTQKTAIIADVVWTITLETAIIADKKDILLLSVFCKMLIQLYVQKKKISEGVNLCWTNIIWVLIITKIYKSIILEGIVLTNEYT